MHYVEAALMAEAWQSPEEGSSDLLPGAATKDIRTQLAVSWAQNCLCNTFLQHHKRLLKSYRVE